MRMASGAIVVIVGAGLLMAGCTGPGAMPTSPSSVESGGRSSALVPAVASADGQQEMPFKGTFGGTDRVTPPATIATTAAGTGTLVGRLSFTDVLTLTSPSGGTGTGHWVAANGDSIDTTFVASAVPGAVVFDITEEHVVTGGSGRFAGVSGSFSVHRTHVVSPSDDGTHVTSGSFEGTITVRSEGR